MALSQSGVEAGYGASSGRHRIAAAAPESWSRTPSPAPPPRRRRESDARRAGADRRRRGRRERHRQASIDKLNEGLFPSAAGASHTFSVLDLGRERAAHRHHGRRPTSPRRRCRTSEPSGRAAGTVGLHAVQRPHRHGRAAADDAFSQLAGAEGQRPRPRHPLQRRRLPRHRERGRLHDRRAGPHHRPDVREDGLQRQAPDDAIRSPARR